MEENNTEEKKEDINNVPKEVKPPEKSNRELVLNNNKPDEGKENLSPQSGAPPANIDILNVQVQPKKKMPDRKPIEYLCEESYKDKIIKELKGQKERQRPTYVLEAETDDSFKSGNELNKVVEDKKKKDKIILASTTFKPKNPVEEAKAYDSASEYEDDNYMINNNNPQNSQPISNNQNNQQQNNPIDNKTPVAKQDTYIKGNQSPNPSIIGGNAPGENSQLKMLSNILKPPRRPSKITLTDLNDPYVALKFCAKAYIDQYYRLADLFVCCALKYRYKISLGFDKEGKDVFNLFNTRDESSSCQNDCCPNQSRSMDIYVDNVRPENGQIQTFAELMKPCRCGLSCFCSCCTRPKLKVMNVHKGELMGRIEDKPTMCSPEIDIYYERNRNPSYIMVDGCCQCLNSTDIEIYKGDDVDRKNLLGKVTRTLVPGDKYKPDVEHMEILFPIEAGPVEKFLIISGGLFFFYLHYQRLSTSKRCHN